MARYTSSFTSDLVDNLIRSVRSRIILETRARRDLGRRDWPRIWGVERLHRRYRVFDTLQGRTRVPMQRVHPHREPRRACAVQAFDVTGNVTVSVSEFSSSKYYKNFCAFVHGVLGKSATSVAEAAIRNSPVDDSPWKDRDEAAFLFHFHGMWGSLCCGMCRPYSVASLGKLGLAVERRACRSRSFGIRKFARPEIARPRGEGY